MGVGDAQVILTTSQRKGTESHHLRCFCASYRISGWHLTSNHCKGVSVVLYAIEDRWLGTTGPSIEQLPVGSNLMAAMFEARFTEF